MRILRTALLLPLALTVLTGCTPADEPLAALAIRDGEPTVLLVGCDSGPASIHVREDSTMASASPRPTRSATTATPGGPSAGPSGASTTGSPQWSLHTDRAQPVNEIPLLDADPPAGWIVDESTLGRIEPGIWYGISAYGRRDAHPVRFDTDAFAKLDGEHVLAPVSHRKQEIMTRAEFERDAKEACPSS
ncbi:hypothetical protein [Plantactinospora endophytica]|uniref:Uncharacterized protein n=1 Tax=Plantactinospora endophytica TaxID=673535 RepID=A0ABQ4DRT8_9ACTN|nr:hypothetical protein [Plantactinospora endophytica]GIG85164.1 hypothetical protein Pen02_01000 [Plantactinospora endophytica]